MGSTITQSSSLPVRSITPACGAACSINSNMVRVHCKRLVILLCREVSFLHNELCWLRARGEKDEHKIWYGKVKSLSDKLSCK